MRRARGFTLVELLITTAITGVIMATMYSAFRTGMFGYRSVGARIDSYRAARGVLDRMAVDARNAVLYNGTDSLQGFEGDDSSVRMCTTLDTFIADAVTTELAMVRYAQEGDRVVRVNKPSRAAFDQEADIPAVTMLDNATLSVEYGFMPAGGGPLQFKAEWGKDAAEEKRSLPRAMRFTVFRAGDEGFSYSRTVYLPEVSAP